MKRIIINLMLLLPAIAIQAASPTAYRIFDSKGAETDFDTMVDSLSRADAVFIGENHNCPISHWMELEISRALFQRHGSDLVIGQEMMEADNQLILDEYMAGITSYDRFEAEARLWDNYSTDYYPTVYFAKDNKIPFVATNVPRRYAAAVSSGGLDALQRLSQEALQYIAPLPIPFAYDTAAAGEKFGAMMLISRRSPEEMQRLAEAQALKDATMGWFMARNMKPSTKFLHINGSMHSDNRDGIIPYLLKYRPDTRVATVTSRRQDDIDTLDPDYLGAADFYIVVQTEFPTSY